MSKKKINSPQNRPRLFGCSREERALRDLKAKTILNRERNSKVLRVNSVHNVKAFDKNVPKALGVKEICDCHNIVK